MKFFPKIFIFLFSTIIIINHRNIQEKVIIKSSYKYEDLSEPDIDLNSTKFISLTSDKISLYFKTIYKLYINSINVIKSGNTENLINALSYGINSAIKQTKSRDIEIYNSNITISGKGTIGIYLHGYYEVEEYHDYYKNSFQNNIFKTSSKNEYQIGIFVNEGYFYSINNTIITDCKNCPAMVSYKKKGTYNIYFYKSYVETYGKNSPNIYIFNGGYFHTDNSNFFSKSQIAVMRGDSTYMYYYKCNFESYAEGNPIYKGFDYTVFFIYGDGNEKGISNTYGKDYDIYLIESTIILNSESEYFNCAPIITITNAIKKIFIRKLVITKGKGLFLREESSKFFNNNGAEVDLVIKNSNIEGDIFIDKKSYLNLTLIKTNFTGTINKNDISSQVIVKLNESSNITLKEKSYFNISEDSKTYTINGARENAEGSGKGNPYSDKVCNIDNNEKETSEINSLNDINLITLEEEDETPNEDNISDLDIGVLVDSLSSDMILYILNNYNLINGSNYTVQTYLTNEEIEYDDLSSLDLGECENILKNYYNIDNNEQLIVFKIDYKNESRISNQVEYKVYDINGNELNLNLCNETTISILTPVNINNLKVDINTLKDLYNNGYDIFDSYDSFYNDICSKYSSNSNTDITLQDRKNDFYQSICESNCTYNYFDLNSNKVNCSCLTKINVNIEKTDFSENLANSFKNVMKNSNIKVVKCYKSLFNFENLLKNYGNIFVFSCIIFEVILCIFFFVNKWKFILVMLRNNKVFNNNLIKINDNPPIKSLSNKNNNNNKSKNNSNYHVDNIRKNTVNLIIYIFINFIYTNIFK